MGKIVEFFTLDEQPLFVVKKLSFYSWMEKLESWYIWLAQKDISETALP